jgi:hypothetical protein
MHQVIIPSATRIESRVSWIGHGFSQCVLNDEMIVVALSFVEQRSIRVSSIVALPLVEANSVGLSWGCILQSRYND